MNCQTELYEQPVSHRKDFVLKLNDEEVKVSLPERRCVEYCLFTRYSQVD